MKNKCVAQRGFSFPEKMKIKAMKHLIVGNGNTEVLNKKESLLTKDFIINFKELSDQQVNVQGNHNKTGQNIFKSKTEILSRVLFINGDSFH